MSRPSIGVWTTPRASVIAFLVGLLIAAFAGPATAHLQWANSVDTSTNPGEIRWLDNQLDSSMDDERQWATDRWNYVGKIVIARDTASTVADLEFQTDSSDPGLCGKYIPYATVADDIKFYDPVWDGLAPAKRDACATHELGHALSLGHVPTTIASVMDGCATCSNPYYYRYPTTHDRNDYVSKWGN